MWYGMWKSDLLRESSSFDSICKSIEEVFTKNNSGLFLIELPTESYCKTNLLTIKNLLKNGFNGVYVSFQRPVENIHSWFKQFDIDLDKIKVLDGTNGSKNKKEVLPKDVEKIFDKIHKSLQGIKSNKKFVFIDSITTMALINTEPWSNSFSKYLINLKENIDFEKIIFLVNVAKDLSEKKLVKNISSYADGFFYIGNSKDGYSIEVVKPNILT